MPTETELHQSQQVIGNDSRLIRNHAVHALMQRILPGIQVKDFSYPAITWDENGGLVIIKLINAANLLRANEEWIFTIVDSVLGISSSGTDFRNFPQLSLLPSENASAAIVNIQNREARLASVFCLRRNIARVSKSGLIVRDIQRRVPLGWQVIHLLPDASQPSTFKVVLLISQAISSSSS